MRKLIPALGLQLIAVALALLQFQIGIRTDEAKYLLNIPYPHPPGGRFILSLLKTWEFQELFWRLVFATLLLQAVWLVWDIARDFSKNQRFIVSLSWIFSSAVLLQAGTVMMAPLTALQALVLLWIGMRPETAAKHRGLVALFWLWSVFTAYQAVLFAPVAFFALRRRPLVERLLYVGVPLLLLSLYTLSNPLAAASFAIHGERQLTESIVSRLLETGRIWLLGGSVILSITGLAGLIRTRRWELLLSFLLVTAYVALSRYDYYAILFVPLLAVGFSRFFDPHCKTAPWFEVPVWTLLLAVGSVVMLWFHPLPPFSVARGVMQSIDLTQTDLILISGSYGHEWQYESPSILRRYTESLLPDASGVICLEDCPWFDRSGWVRTHVEPEVWVRD